MLNRRLAGAAALLALCTLGGCTSHDTKNSTEGLDHFGDVHNVSVYGTATKDAIRVKLFTKDGDVLCDSREESTPGTGYSSLCNGTAGDQFAYVTPLTTPIEEQQKRLCDSTNQTGVDLTILDLASLPDVKLGVYIDQNGHIRQLDKCQTS